LLYLTYLQHSCSECEQFKMFVLDYCFSILLFFKSMQMVKLFRNLKFSFDIILHLLILHRETHWQGFSQKVRLEKLKQQCTKS